MSSAFWRANTALNVASDSTSVPVGTRGRPDGPATAIAARVTVRAGLRLGQIVTRTMLQKRPSIRALASEGSLMRSEEHTSELQSLMRISYAVFCLKKKNKNSNNNQKNWT